MSLIEVRGLRKVFGKGEKETEVLKGVDLSVEEGEIFGVVGLSGAGKSTLVRCINRLERASSGSIRIGGTDVLSLSERELRLARRDMGMIFQSFNLLSGRTAAGNVSFPLEVGGLTRGEIKKRTMELLEMVGLSEKAGSYPAELSGGQKQRVGIARALATNPKILLSDEATSALDPQTTSSILNLISDVQKRLGLTVLLITHEMKVITEICDRVAVMDQGVIVEEGRVIDVFTNPQSPITKSFVEVILKRTSRFLENGYRPKGKLLRLRYVGEAVASPLMADLVVMFGVEPIILQAHVDHIKDAPFGTLLVDLKGDEARLKRAISYLEEKKALMEVMN
jgi:D-methionine transport system ATP-binding protein